jgi:F-type H+-transporting ATPase subunit a
MVWVVGAITFLVVTSLVRRYLKQSERVPRGGMNVLEFLVEFLRDTVAEPNLGKKYMAAWAPLLLTLFFFILTANLIGLIPIFEVLGLLDHYVLHTGEHSFVKAIMHGGSTATANFNVTVGLALITFFSIIIAGTKKHGFVQHWKNLVPPGLATPVYFLLVPLEFIGMLVRPFALTMRLAANMAGGHIAILAILSFVFIFTELFASNMAGMGIGFAFSLPLAVAISGLEILVVLVQAYVFTLLTAVFIGMAIHANH